METATTEECQEALEELSGAKANKQLMAEMYANQLSGTYDKDKAKEMAEYMAENGGGGNGKRY